MNFLQQLLWYHHLLILLPEILKNRMRCVLILYVVYLYDVYCNRVFLYIFFTVAFYFQVIFWKVKNYNYTAFLYLLLHKKWSFPLWISSVNVNKFAGKLQIWSHLVKKSLMENFIVCVVHYDTKWYYYTHNTLSVTWPST